ncbi:AAA1 [Symbiodinium sp. KB8]|nr:AAA1 [Symbiodinium sp. KB8]
MLAKAAAASNKATFFNVSSATLVSKWRGESEKIIKALFEEARCRAPSIIFMDEVDALVSSGATDGENSDGARRLLTQLLIQMDGLVPSSSSGSGSSSGGVMVLATTNRPWDISPAFLRRLEKRLHIPLPDQSAREAMLRQYLGPVVAPGTAIDYSAIAATLKGYSGADIRVACREASMRPVRRMLHGKNLEDLQVQRQKGQLSPPPVTAEDVAEAMKATKPSVSPATLRRYEEWEKEFGSQ